MFLVFVGGRGPDWGGVEELFNLREGGREGGREREREGKRVGCNDIPNKDNILRVFCFMWLFYFH